MSTVLRTVHINPIEPQPISVRAPAQMETRIEFLFKNQDGSVLTSDPAAQLHLTGRSGTRTESYAVPGIDIANGKARVVIPTGALTDMNGYRMRLFGTVAQQPMLIAMGLLSLTPAAGVDATPDDVIDTIDLLVKTGIAASFNVKLWYDAAKTNPYDIASVTLAAPISGGGAVTGFTIVQIGYNEVNLSLTADEVDLLPPQCRWALRASTGGGVTTLAEGFVNKAP